MGCPLKSPATVSAHDRSQLRVSQFMRLLVLDLSCLDPKTALHALPTIEYMARTIFVLWVILFAAVHESACGTSGILLRRTAMSAIGATPDMRVARLFPLLT